MLLKYKGVVVIHCREGACSETGRYFKAPHLDDVNHHIASYHKGDATAAATLHRLHEQRLANTDLDIPAILLPAPHPQPAASRGAPDATVGFWCGHAHCHYASKSLKAMNQHRFRQKHKEPYSKGLVQLHYSGKGKSTVRISILYM